MIEINFNIQPSELSEIDRLNFITSWEKYNLEILGHFHLNYRNRLNTDLEKKSFYVGEITKNEVDSVKEIIKINTSKSKFINDSDINFVHTNFKELGLEKAYNRDSKFFEQNLILQNSINKILDRIKDKIAEQLGSPWRNLMTRFWETESTAEKENMYSWHTDGMPHEFFKIMLYFNSLNLDNGSLQLKENDEEIVLESDNPGSFVLFKNSMIFHKGLPPKTSNIKRYACEVTICRSFDFFIMSTNAGNNAHYPIAPWAQALTFNNLNNKDYKKNIKIKKISNINKIKKNYFNKLDDKKKELVYLISKIRNLKTKKNYFDKQNDKIKNKLGHLISKIRNLKINS